MDFPAPAAPASLAMPTASIAATSVSASRSRGQSVTSPGPSMCPARAGASPRPAPKVSGCHPPGGAADDAGRPVDIPPRVASIRARLRACRAAWRLAFERTSRVSGPTFDRSDSARKDTAWTNSGSPGHSASCEDTP